VYAAFAALTQLGIAVQLTGNTLLIVLAGAALAMGLAFGLGGREMAGRALGNLFDRDTMMKPTATQSNGTMPSNGTTYEQSGYQQADQGAYQQGGYDQSGYQPPQEQHPATHAAPQSGGWSNGTAPDGNWQGGGQR
jgi:hypothetical protein